jgi:hypothetical protein
LLIAEIFGVPGTSGATTDALIKQDKYPLTHTEALLFAALSRYAWNCQNHSHERLLNGWGHLEFSLKMMLGFHDLRPALTGADGLMPHCMQLLWEDWLEIKKARQEIHDNFSASLDNME